MNFYELPTTNPTPKPTLHWGLDKSLKNHTSEVVWISHLVKYVEIGREIVLDLPIDSKGPNTFRVQKRCKDIGKIVHVTSGFNHNFWNFAAIVETVSLGTTPRAKFQKEAQGHKAISPMQEGDCQIWGK